LTSYRTCGGLEHRVFDNPGRWLIGLWFKAP
jgi:hypothetical protein